MKDYKKINSEICGWELGFPKAPEYSTLTTAIKADWVVIGAGFSGLSAAYRLAESCPDESIVILDAEQAGKGSSTRNSGFAVEISLNDGGSAMSDEAAQMIKSRLNLEGLAKLKQWVDEYHIDCDWDPSGKIHCAVESRNIDKLKRFEDFLDRHNLKSTSFDKAALSKRLGTSFYEYGVQTHQGVLLNPAALINGLLKNLPENVTVYENSPVLDIQPGEPVQVTTKQGSVSATKMIVAVNSLMPRLGIKQNRVFPLTLTASLSEQLSDEQYQSIGSPEPWGVLSASNMGATVRLTNDRRILVRNTVEWCPGLTFQANDLATRAKTNLQGLQRRFPTFTDLKIDSCWSGNVCISRNTKPVFEKISDNSWLIGCYNAGGVSMGTLFGQLIVDYALGKSSESLDIILAMDKPALLPPKPFLVMGLKTKLAIKRRLGASEL